MPKYEYDDCTFCGGRVTERRIQKPCFWGDKLIALVDGVPTGCASSAASDTTGRLCLNESRLTLKVGVAPGRFACL